MEKINILSEREGEDYNDCTDADVRYIMIPFSNLNKYRL